MSQTAWNGNPHLRDGRPRSQSRNKTTEGKAFCDYITGLMGGRGRLVALTGARQFHYDPISPALSWRFAGCSRANKVRVEQHPGKSAFHLLFWQVSRDSSTQEFVGEIYMIPSDKLAAKFSEFTNLILG